MRNDKPIIKSNANFHKATASSVFDVRNDAAFKEYRRRWSENPPNFIVEGFPIHLDIESSNACNLKCPFCATTSHFWGPSQAGLLDFELFKKVVDEGAVNGLCAIKLSLRGEPLINKEITKMVRYAKRKGIIDVYFNTNGMLLTGDISSQLIDAGLDRISISFEGIDKTSYEKYRPGATYETVIDNVKRLVAMRKEKGVNNPQIRVQTVMLPELKPTFDHYVNFWKNEVGADEVSYLDARNEGPGFDHRGRAATWACPFLWQRMTVLWDGTLLPCLMHGVDDFSLMALGNVRDVSVKEMWSGIRENQIRQLHLAGKAHELGACDMCSYRAMEIKKNTVVG
jgi:MoaA/NifB/PqqE/SkfB family radical SAM enzyme